MRKPVAKDLDLANQLTIWESLFRQSLHMPQRLPNRLVVPWLDRVQGAQPSGVHIQQYAIEVDDWLRKNCGGNRAVHTTWSRRAWYLRAVPRGKMEGMQLIRLCLTDERKCGPTRHFGLVPTNDQIKQWEDLHSESETSSEPVEDEANSNFGSWDCDLADGSGGDLDPSASLDRERAEALFGPNSPAAGGSDDLDADDLPDGPLCGDCGDCAGCKGTTPRRRPEVPASWTSPTSPVVLPSSHAAPVTSSATSPVVLPAGHVSGGGAPHWKAIPDLSPMQAHLWLQECHVQTDEATAEDEETEEKDAKRVRRDSQ